MNQSGDFWGRLLRIAETEGKISAQALPSDQREGCQHRLDLKQQAQAVVLQSSPMDPHSQAGEQAIQDASRPLQHWSLEKLLMWCTKMKSYHHNKKYSFHITLGWKTMSWNVTGHNLIIFLYHWSHLNRHNQRTSAKCQELLLPPSSDLVRRVDHRCPNHQRQTDQSEAQQKASQFQPDQACTAYELESSLIHWDILFHQEWDKGSDTSLLGHATWPSWIFFLLTVKWEFCNSKSPFDIYEWEHLLAIAVATSRWPHLRCGSLWNVTLQRRGVALPFKDFFFWW